MTLGQASESAAANDYPGRIKCSFCRIELRRRTTAVRVTTNYGEPPIDLCEPCYRGHWLVDVHDDSGEPFEPRLSLRAIVAQRAALLLIQNLVTAGLEPDQPANLRLMQQVAELILGDES